MKRIDSQIFEFFDVTATQLPAIRLINIKSNLIKYKYDNKNEISSVNLTHFVQKCLDKKIVSHYRSQKLPEDWNNGPVQTLVQSNTISLSHDSSKAVWVEFYAPWCGICQRMEPVYNLLGTHFENHSDVFVAKIDATLNEIPYIIRSFLIIMLFPKIENTQPIVFGGNHFKLFNLLSARLVMVNVNTEITYDSELAKAKIFARDGDLEQALECLNFCKSINNSPKLIKKIQKIMDAMKNEKDTANQMQINDNDLKQNFEIPDDTFNRLYAYQRDAVHWMWNLYRRRTGGILADEMGMGKTIETIAFIMSLFVCKENDVRVLVVSPLSLITMWKNELRSWAPAIRTYVYRGSVTERRRNIFKTLVSGGVLLSNYQTVQSSLPQILQVMNNDCEWDVIILDEGHQLKNSSSVTHKSICAIPARSKFILTGTAIQNNLTEFWALFNITNPNGLLGSKQVFKTEFQNPIESGREKDATNNSKRLGIIKSQELKDIIQDYILRRTRNFIDSFTKYDLVAWCPLTEHQLQIYRDFLCLDEVKMLFNSKQSPLVALTVLKKICDHPQLLSEHAMKLLNYNDTSLPLTNDSGDIEKQHRRYNESTIWQSGKTVFFYHLIKRLTAEGHRTLVFSSFRKILDIIETVLDKCEINFIRLDGSIKCMDARAQMIADFQSGSVPVMLLTTKVGGLGLTLTGADRVVVYDPSWNPAIDDQAIDRACRIGQNKNVVVYRLITCATVEEKIYRRQIFKSSLFKIMMGQNINNPTRYFTHEQLRDLFKMPVDHRVSPTCVQIQQLHGFDINDDYLQSEINNLVQFGLYGVSIHHQVNASEEADVQSPSPSSHRQLPKAVASQVTSTNGLCETSLTSKAIARIHTSTPKKISRCLSDDEYSDDNSQFITSLLNLSIECENPTPEENPERNACNEDKKDDRSTSSTERNDDSLPTIVLSSSASDGDCDDEYAFPS
ncbi:hypothetical protein GJ496_000669 [Pomphorhynchus laevis]|nr:hypothetical protein GJ496_000669 [Pomphorhynchus laevis]